MSGNSELAILLNDVSEYYKIKFCYPDSIVEKEVKALENINLTLSKGESLALLGPNGAGKTTLLKIIAGLLKPDKGEVKVNGRVCGVFELGAGFVPELTGYENLKFNLSFYNCDEKKIQEIIDFSELEDFIYAPLKTYSQGMYLRLAFSLAIHTDPDILVIDDILAVGDYHFQKKCLDKIKSIVAVGKTVILVTHNLQLAESFCQRGIILERGRIIADDKLNQIKDTFLEIIGNIWGLGCIRNEEIKLIFNNGRIALIYKNIPLTVDLGIFASFGVKNSILYSMDFKWEVKEEENKIEAKAFFSKENVCVLKIQLINDEIFLSLESKYPKKELNFMFSNAYSRVKTQEGIFELPDVSKEQMREWHKITEFSYTNYIKLIPQGNQTHPSLLLLVGSYESKFELFNFNFTTSVRIVRLTTTESILGIKILLTENIETEVLELKNLNSSTLIQKLNSLLLQNNKNKKQIIKEICFLSHVQREPLINYKFEILDCDNFSNFRALIQFEEPKFSILFTTILKDSKVIFKFSSLTIDVSRFLNGIGILIPNIYRYCLSNYIDGQISLQEESKNSPSIFMSRWLNLIPIQKEYPVLKIVFNRETAVEIRNITKPKIDYINFRFLCKLDKDDYIIELNL